MYEHKRVCAVCGNIKQYKRQNLETRFDIRFPEGQDVVNQLTDGLQVC